MKATRPSTRKNSPHPPRCRACKSSRCERATRRNHCRGVAMKPSFVSRILMLAAALLLAACSTYRLDNAVQSFSHIGALPSPLTYRFERLPSQQDPQHAQLEAMADGALNTAGFKRDDANPRYSVQISARTAATLSPWAAPWEGA